MLTDPNLARPLIEDEYNSSPMWKNKLHLSDDASQIDILTAIGEHLGLQFDLNLQKAVMGDNEAMKIVRRLRRGDTQEEKVSESISSANSTADRALKVLPDNSLFPR